MAETLILSAPFTNVSALRTALKHGRRIFVTTGDGITVRGATVTLKNGKTAVRNTELVAFEPRGRFWCRAVVREGYIMRVIKRQTRLQSPGARYIGCAQITGAGMMAATNVVRPRGVCLPLRDGGHEFAPQKLTAMQEARGETMPPEKRPAWTVTK